MPETPKRRLAAIVSTDVVGYSRLMGIDETGTLATLRLHRQELIDPLIKRHNGRIVKTMGDGLLLEFGSVVEATQCMIEFQQGMAGRNGGLAEDQQMVFRIGVNLGDIIIEGDDIFGDGVNIAARLQELATPGGVAIAGRVYEDVRDRLDVKFKALGERDLKNISRPIQIWQWSPETRNSTSPIILSPGRGAPKVQENASIAVLPFDNMSGDPEQDYFADGIVEDIITGLSRFRSLFVIARNSTFAYKGQSPDIREVARALGVNYVLEGSIRQGRGRARITVQLIDAATGNHVWAERFDRQLDDEFAVQDEIAQRISSILTERIWQDVAHNIGQKQRQDYNAYDHALLGLEMLHRIDPGSMAEAIQCFHEGLAIDPDQLYGHIGLGYCYLWSSFWSAKDDTLPEQAHDHALIAARIAPNEAQSYRLLSRTHAAFGRWEESWDCVKRALRLDPNDGDILGNRGIYHLFHGEFGEAVEWLDKVLEMHADTPHTVDIMRYWKAFALFAMSDYGAAAALLRSISGLDFIKAELLAACYFRLGEIDEAKARVAELLSAYPDYQDRKSVV